MFYKLLSFILVYILSIINFTIILSPLLFFIVPIIATESDLIKSDSIIAIVLIIFFLISCITNIILLFDLIFGFSSRASIKGTKDYRKLKNYDIFDQIFEDIKMHFNTYRVKLLISDSAEVNAYAVGNLGRKYIVLTQGLINHYLMEFENRDNFLSCIKGIIGHEMSHLINKDYLPGLMLTINEKATKFVSKIILGFFNIFINIIQYIPIIGRIISGIIIKFYELLDFLISFFYKYIILSIYKFIQLKVGREKEYRCDFQSAQVCGGDVMALALSSLGEDGYSTIFSSHPKTSSRVKSVRNIEKAYNVIKPQCGNGFVNFIFILSILLTPFITLYFININGLIENYEEIYMKINYFILNFKANIQNFISTKLNFNKNN